MMAAYSGLEEGQLEYQTKLRMRSPGSRLPVGPGMVYLRTRKTGSADEVTLR